MNSKLNGRVIIKLMSSYNREGELFYPNGNTYKGQFHKDLKHGYGELTLHNGMAYKGNWYIFFFF